MKTEGINLKKNRRIIQNMRGTRVLNYRYIVIVNDIDTAKEK